MGTQTEIAKQIMGQKGDYVLAVKGNQPTLHQDIIEYFADDALLLAVKQAGHYKRTVEKARGQIEKREYYQTNDIGWMSRKESWKKLSSIGMVEKKWRRMGKSRLNGDITLAV